MNKKQLKEYRALVKEIPKIKRDIDLLQKKLDKVPVVAGKVQKSSKDFPYIMQHVKVEVAEPRLATEIKKQIRYKELRLDKAEREKTEIEKFIANIEDSTERQIFELMYLGERKITQQKVGEMLGYDQSSISLKINKYLKDS